ncbi:MAG: putative beta-lysine N-acetyltransferase [Bdellovibrionota bacterium]
MTDEKKVLVEDIVPEPTKTNDHKGIIEITLDDGVKVKAVGLVYGVEHTIRGEGFTANLFLDHYNQRIRVSYYEGANIGEMIEKVRYIAEANNYDKIIFKASQTDWQHFLPHGYVLEAVIKFFHHGKSAYVMSKFRSQERLTSQSLMSEILLIENLMSVPSKLGNRTLADGYECRLARREDVPAMAKLYSEIFQSYPSPLSHEAYLETVFQKNNIFSVIYHGNELVSAASAELNPTAKAAELTDCATLKEHRGRGLMTVILERLEQELMERKYICGFTMARARSFGMNQVFYNMGYVFMGRLINNCDIYGAYEDMNIWVRDLRKKEPPKS